MADRLIEARDLSLRYPDGTQALGGLDLDLEQGQRLALLGENGAGKSTLLLALAGLLKPTGELRVAGADPRQDPRRARQALGLLFQDPDDMLFSPTLWDDLAFAPRQQGLDAGEVEARVHRALHAMDLEGSALKSPFHLSQGQKKRAALACLLCQGPEVWALDEPSSNLDPRARRRMVETLKGLPGGMLLATHDLELARELCPQAVVLRSGRAQWAGPTETLLGGGVDLAGLGLA